MLYAWDKVCQLMVVLSPEEININIEGGENVWNGVSFASNSEEKQKNHVALMRMSNSIVRLMKYDGFSQEKVSEEKFNLLFEHLVNGIEGALEADCVNFKIKDFELI